MQNTKMTGLQFFAESAAAETETGTGVNTSSTAKAVPLPCEGKVHKEGDFILWQRQRNRGI